VAGRPKKKTSGDLSFDELVAKVNAKFGAGAIMRASSARALTIPRLQTGIFGIDYITGGGFPIGRIIGIYGLRSSCKTLVALKTAAAAQGYCRKHLCKMKRTEKRKYRCEECGYRGDELGGLCPECKELGYESHLVDKGDFELKCPECGEYNPFRVIWWDAEGSFENRWAAALGVDCSKLLLSRAEYAEQGVDMADAFLRAGACELFVIDTLAHLIPSAEIEASATDWQMGLQARLINKLLRRSVSAQNAQKLNSGVRPTVLLLNQVRMKLGVMFGNPETKPGGMGQEFATTIDLRMRGGKYEKDEYGNTLSQLVKATCEKNKSAPPQMECTFRVWLADIDGHTPGDTNELKTILGVAQSRGWFGDSSSGWVYDDKKFKTAKSIYKYLVENPDELERLRQTLLAERLGTIEEKDALKNIGLEGDDA